jgi:hypothetical protein
MTPPISLARETEVTSLDQPVLQWRRSDGAALDGATVRAGKSLWMHENWLVYQGPPSGFRIYRNLGIIDSLLRRHGVGIRQRVATLRAQQSGVAESTSTNPWIAGVPGRTRQASYFFTDDRKVSGPRITVTSADFSLELSTRKGNAEVAAGAMNPASAVQLGGQLGGSASHQRLTFEVHGISDPEIEIGLVLPWSSGERFNARTLVDDLLNEVDPPSSARQRHLQRDRVLREWLPEESPPGWVIEPQQTFMNVAEGGVGEGTISIYAPSSGACLMAVTGSDLNLPSVFVVSEFVAIQRRTDSFF